jgi:hypothetical protein
MGLGRSLRDNGRHGQLNSIVLLQSSTSSISISPILRPVVPSGTTPEQHLLTRGCEHTPRLVGVVTIGQAYGSKGSCGFAALKACIQPQQPSDDNPHPLFVMIF